MTVKTTPENSTAKLIAEIDQFHAQVRLEMTARALREYAKDERPQDVTLCPVEQAIRQVLSE